MDIMNGQAHRTLTIKRCLIYDFSMLIKQYQPLLIIIPVICALLDFRGAGSIYKYTVAFTCGAILCLAYGKDITKDIWIVVIAFMFSIAGGWFLSNRRGLEIRFIYGIICYFIAHLGFLCFAIKNGQINKWVLCVTLIVYLTFFLTMLYKNINSKPLTLAVLCYLLISCISFAAATGLNFHPLPKWLFAAGIFSLLFSDTLIAFKEFLNYDKLYSFLMMPTYYLSHILITLGLLINMVRGK